MAWTVSADASYPPRSEAPWAAPTRCVGLTSATAVRCPVTASARDGPATTPLATAAAAAMAVAAPRPSQDGRPVPRNDVRGWVNDERWRD